MNHQKSLGEMHEKVDLLQATMNDVKDILEERSDLLTTSRPRLRAAIPANGGVFHGRNPLVAQLVHILTSNSDAPKRPRVCLLGPGGMGKTSTALAVMAHPEMRECFPEQNQVWVPCVKATSVALFLDTLYSSLGTKKNSGNTLKDIKSEIASSAEPLILLLDNFETPWNLLESRSETEQILYELDQISTIVLFITMRSSIPPCHGNQWQSVDIDAVDEEAARRIYLDICSVGSDDGDLSELLQTLGCMPLAITLMANMTRMTGLGAGKLSQEYKRIGTSMLRQGTDAKHNLDICISLSVDSPPMKAHPEAYELLSTLATLPVGTTYDILAKWWLRDSPNVMSALQVLAETSLIQRRVTNYSVLPVIRSFILDPSRFPSRVRTMTISSACDFLAHHDSLPGNSSYKAHADAISAEEGILQAILLDTTDPEPRLIQALLVLARYQLLTRPRLEVIEHTLKLVRQMASHQGLVGDTLTCYGRILSYLDRYGEAREQLILARKAFLSVPDEQQAAKCTFYLAELPFKPGASAIDRETKLQSLTDAKSVFEKIGDTQGVALSLYYLGKVNGRYGNHTESIELLIHAHKKFQDRGDVLNRARCSLNLEHIFFRARRYDEALIAGMIAIQDHDQLGQYAGSPMYFLGKILLAKGDYPAALEISIQALRVCKAYGRRRHIAETLQVIGRIWAKMGRTADAQGAYTEALRCYGTNVADTSGRSEDFATSSGFLSRQAETPGLVPTDQEKRALLRHFSDFTDVSHH